MKTVLGVIGGYVVWTALWLGGNGGIKGIMPDRYQADGFSQDVVVLCMALVLSVVCSLLGGWVAGRLATSPARAGLILGILLLLTGLGVQIGAWKNMPVWYHLIFLVLLLPVTRVGAARAAAGRPAIA